MSNILVNKMTDGATTPFENIENVVVSALHTIRPDGQVFRIGDYYHNENLQAYDFTVMNTLCFYAGNFYENSRLKGFAYDNTDFNIFTYGTTGLSPVQFLAMNDPAVSYIYEGTAPLTNTTSYPNTNIFAKSANDDANAFAVFMTMPENFVASHAHA